MKKIKKISISCIVLVLLINTNCKKQEEATTITIHNKSLHEINDHLFGHFLEKASWHGEIGGDLAIDPETGKIFPGVLRLMKKLNIPNIRFPGGGDVDYYPWYNLIDNVPGHHQQRPDYYTRDGKKVVSDHRLGLDEFLSLCENINAEPILVANLGDPFLNNTTIEKAAQNAAGMVAYCNGTKKDEYPGLPIDWVSVRKKNGREAPYNVKYFEVGNEPWLFSEGLPMKGGLDSLIVHYMDCLEAIVLAMKAVDPDITMITDGGIKEVSQQIQQRLGDNIDYLAYHPYLPWEIDTVYRDNKPVPIDSLSKKEIWNTWVSTPVIDTATGMSKFVDDDYFRHSFGTSYPVAMTEWNWNGWFSDELRKNAALSSRYAKGIGAASFIHAMLRKGDRIKIANQSLLIGQAWDISSIRVFPGNGREPVLFPTGHVTGFYANHHGNTMLDMSIKNMDYYQQPYRMGAIKPAEKIACLDVCITRGNNMLYVHAINRSFDEDKTAIIDLSEFQTGDVAKHNVLKGKIEEGLLEKQPDSLSYEEQNTLQVENPFRVTFPKRSVSCIEIPVKL